jgi:transposase
MSDLPSDPALLRQTAMALSSRLAALSAKCSTLSAERDAAIAQRDAAVQENDKLLMILSQYKRTIFGPRSETLDPGQLSLFTITTQAARAAANDDVTGGRLPDGAEGRGKRPGATQPREASGALAAHRCRDRYREPLLPLLRRAAAQDRGDR